MLNNAGEAIDHFRTYEAQLPAKPVPAPGAAPAPDNVYHPFQTKLDWDVAEWAKTRGIGANQFNALLKIEGVSIFHTYFLSRLIF